MAERFAEITANPEKKQDRSTLIRLTQFNVTHPATIMDNPGVLA
jgi:hypothetical protein